MPHTELYIGTMSGTSMDSVDVVLVAINATGQIKHLADHEHPMPTELRARLLDVCIGQPTSLVEIGTLDHLLGHLFADSVHALLKKTGHSPGEIRAIGNHGQTVFHQPAGDTPFTMQIGDANIIAAKTGIDTIADFRRKDMALGGQGAPLAPAFHAQVFTPSDSTIVVLNIGGISNITVMQPEKTTFGYDTGPGNMLMDAWGQKHTGEKYDKNARFAQTGQVSDALLKRLLQEPYLEKKFPKSTGRELFNLDWLETQIAGLNLPPEDVQHTLCLYTAQTIATEIEPYTLGPSPEVLVCGGGGKNPLLMKMLEGLLPKWHVLTTDARDISSDYMEAMTFAWLAYRRIHGLPSNLPEVTGAKVAASLGVIYPAR